MISYIQAVTTVATRSQAQQIARFVLEQRLAACVQILPCSSMYHWQGSIEESEEFLCIMKTRADLFGPLQEAVAKHHPYEVPEILSLPITGGNVSYLDWLHDELREQGNEHSNR